MTGASPTFLALVNHPPTITNTGGQSMILKFLLPLLAAMGLGVAVYTVMDEGKARPPAPPAVDPAAPPFSNYVAGAGLVEASTENIAIGTPIAGVVQAVKVKAGDHVNAGDALFTIDDRSIRAELAVRAAALAVARTNLARLQAQPRAEDLPPAEARVEAARVVAQDLESQLVMWERADNRAVSAEELSKRRFAVASARANLREAEGDLAKLRAGAWAPDLQVAQAEVASAQAQADAAGVELNRHTITAPVAGEVLRVNIRAGEFAAAGVQIGGGSPSLDTAQMVLGATDTLHVRVDIDENDAWRLRPGAPARAFVRGNPSLATPLKFVRFEPYVIPKKSLTGASTERVDTRVLQVLFSFSHADLPVFVGQQMDVFIDSGNPSRPTTPNGTAQ
jgi:multidrug resistance efflux pump